MIINQILNTHARAGSVDTATHSYKDDVKLNHYALNHSNFTSFHFN